MMLMLMMMLMLGLLFARAEKQGGLQKQLLKIEFFIFFLELLVWSMGMFYIRGI